MADEPNEQTTDEQPDQQQEQPQEVDYKAKYEETLAQARKWEGRSKENSAAARKLAEFEDAQKSELQKLTERAEAAEKARDDVLTKARSATTRSAIVSAATAAGAVDPDAVYRLLDVSSLTLDDDGNPTDAPKHIANLLRDKPYLAGKTANSDASHRGRTDGITNMNDFIRQATGRG